MIENLFWRQKLNKPNMLYWLNTDKTRFAMIRKMRFKPKLSAWHISVGNHFSMRQDKNKNIKNQDFVIEKVLYKVSTRKIAIAKLKKWMLKHHR